MTQQPTASCPPKQHTKPGHFVGHSGVRLTADTGGPPDGTCVVLSPGAGQTRYAWSRSAERLVTCGYRVVSLDLRGHGDSEWAADGDYSIDAFAGDLVAVMAAVPGPLVLVGASIGGIASLLAASRHPEADIRGLVLVDVVPDMRPAGLNRIREFMSAGTAGFTDLDEAADAVARYLPQRPRPPSPARLARNLRRRDDGRWYWHWDPAFHAGSQKRAEDGMLEKMKAACPSISVPTLLLSGSLSEVVDEAGAKQLLDLIPHARWVNIQDAAHMVAGDRNDVFDFEVDRFLAQAGLSAGN